MTVPVQSPINSYTYAGSPTFVYQFYLVAATDLVVTVDGVVADLGVDYTVAGVGVMAGGSITYTSPLTVGQIVTLERLTSLGRTTNYQDEGDFLAATLNADFDRVWMALQEMGYDFNGRALRVPAGETTGDLPLAAVRADTLLAFDPTTGAATISPFTSTQVASAIAAAYSAGQSTADAVTFVGPGNDPNTRRTMQSKWRDIVSALDFKLPTDTSAHQWINRAAAFAGTLVRSIIPSAFDVSTASVYLPWGDYPTTGQIGPFADGVDLHGDGVATVIRSLHTGTIVAMGDGTRFYSNTRVRDLCIIGNYTGTLNQFGDVNWTTQTPVGLKLTQCVRNSSVERVTVTGCTINYQTRNCFGMKVDLLYCTFAKTHNLDSDNGSTTLYTNCRFDWCENDSNALFDGTTTETLSLRMINCFFQNSWKDGLMLRNITTADVYGHFEANNRGATDTSRLYCDINAPSTIPGRGRHFKFGGFFTPGSAKVGNGGTVPAGGFVGIRCNQFNTLDVTQMSLRDSFYQYAVDVIDATSGRLMAAGIDVTGAAQKFNFNPDAIDRFFCDQNGDNRFEISRLRIGGLSLLSTLTASNAVTDGHICGFQTDTTGGLRFLSLRDAECATVPIIIAIKTAGGSGNALRIRTVLDDGVTLSTKKINGAAFIDVTTDGAWVFITSNGVNDWRAKVI